MTKELKPAWGMHGLGYLVYKRTYARPTKNGATEEWNETVDRILDACDKQLKMQLTDSEKQDIIRYMTTMKMMPAGRFLWQLGTPTVKKLGLASLQNCASCPVNHPIKPFTWAMDMLMLGCGVGYNIQKEYVYELPKVRRAKVTRCDTNDADYIVPDSREGWVKLLGKLLKSHFYGGGGFTYSTVLIRGKGAPIKGFGGTASGPEELCWGIGAINDVLNRRAGKKLRPIDALDIMNIIGYVVVAGNVRRSAQIAIGDADDVDFLKAKRWDLGSIPKWRAMSNNSVVWDGKHELSPDFWAGYDGNGEPYGLINLDLSRRVGRLDDDMYPDPDVIGYNPCAEQPLAPYETCVTGDTRIQTREGVVAIKETVGHEVEVFNGEQWSKVKPFLAKPNDEFLKITFSDGSYLKATPYHEFSVSTPTNKKVFKKLRADQLEVGMNLPKFELPVEEGPAHPQAYALGAFTGDGYLDNGYPYICAVEGTQDRMFEATGAVSLNKMWKAEDRVKPMYRMRLDRDDSVQCGTWEELRDHALGLPDQIMDWTKQSVLEFLAGWIDTDGAIRGKGSHGEAYAIYSTSEAKIRDMQLLCRRAGINYASVWRMNKAGEETNYGVRNRDVWVLQIPTFECAEIPTKLKKASNFGSRYKANNAHPEGALIDTAPRQRIVSIEKCENEDSYCFSEPLRNMGVFGNVLTYQCCLAEIFLPNIDSKEELEHVAKYLYRIAKHSLNLACHHPDTERVVHRNQRMGIGITGYLQATEEQKGWLDGCYKKLRAFDAEYSKQMGWPTSIKLTTVKPSGTLSLLAGVTPGVHPGYSQFFIRRIRIASNSPLVDKCRQHGYPVEPVQNFDGSLDNNTMVVAFPCSYPSGTALAADTSAIEQLEYVRRLQSEWSDNAVSCTVYYRPDELGAIQEWLRNNFSDSCKSLSFLLHSEHGFAQAPYEEISEAEFKKLRDATTPITGVNFAEEDVVDELGECESGSCPIK